MNFPDHHRVRISGKIQSTETYTNDAMLRSGFPPENALGVGAVFWIFSHDSPIRVRIFILESQPEYFLLSNFVWYSNWPSRYHKLPSRCATATFTISSKTASQLDSHFHTMTWRDLHNSEEGINSFPILGQYRRPKNGPANSLAFAYTGLSLK